MNNYENVIPDDDIKKIRDIIKAYCEYDLKAGNAITEKESYIAGHKKGLEEGIVKGREAGYEEGYSDAFEKEVKNKIIKNIAKKLLAYNISKEIIAKSTGLSMKNLKEIKL